MRLFITALILPKQKIEMNLAATAAQEKIWIGVVHVVIVGAGGHPNAVIAVENKVVGAGPQVLVVLRV
jgi:hypothetical protein